MLWHPSPPQGFSKEQGQVIIGRPTIALFESPQGISGESAAAINPLLAIYPPLGDTDYTNYKFYQVNNGEFDIPQTDFIWQIQDVVGAGIFQTGGGDDIRPFLNNERDIEQSVVTSNTFDPGFAFNAMQLSDDELHLFMWEAFDIHEWILSAPGVFPDDFEPSDFQFTTSENNGRDIRLIKDGTEIAIVGRNLDTVQIYSLPTPNSFSTTPVLLQSFDPGFNDPASCDFSSDGMNLYVLDVTTDTINQYNLSLPFILPADLTAPNRIFTYDPQVTFSNGNVRMFPDGSAFYLMSTSPDGLCRYDLDEENNIPIISTGPDATFDVMSLDDNPRAMSVSKDGSLIRFSGRENDALIELFIPGILLEYDVTSVNVSTGDFTIDIKVPTIQDLTFVQIAFGNLTATDGTTPLDPGTTLSTFETPLLTKDVGNLLVDDLGRNIMAVEM